MGARLTADGVKCSETDNNKNMIMLAQFFTSGSASQINTRRATASGWIGSVLEYYDFFIYATASALVFPQLFFPSEDPRVAIVASLATYGVGYVARPVGAIFLGHWGDTQGRKKVLLLCMFLMGSSTMAVGLLPTYNQIGWLAPLLLVLLRLVQGFAVAGEISGASTMILEHAPARERGFYASFTLQGVQAGQILAAAVFLPLAAFLAPEDFETWGWRIPFLLSFFVIMAAFIIRRNVEESPVFTKQDEVVQKMAPLFFALRHHWRDMLRVAIMSLMNVIPVVATVFGAAYAVQESYGIGFSASIYLWIPVLGNIIAVFVIPMVGKLSDKVGRRKPIIFGSIGAGLLSFVYLYAISIQNIPMAIGFSLLMWGVIYQGYNAVFPCFYPELFPANVRVTAMAISQNLGTMLTAFFPALFVTIAPPGADNIPLVVGGFAFAVTVVVAITAFSARETYAHPLDTSLSE